MKSIGPCKGCGRTRLINMLGLCKRCNKEASKFVSKAEMEQRRTEHEAQLAAAKEAKEVEAAAAEAAAAEAAEEEGEEEPEEGEEKPPAEEKENKPAEE